MMNLTKKKEYRQMKFDQKYFIGVVTLCTVGLITYLVSSGSVEQNNIVNMLGGITFNLSLFLCSIFGLQYFQLGIGRDIQAEIFDENNTAAAIYEGALFLAIALVISKGL